MVGRYMDSSELTLAGLLHNLRPLFLWDFWCHCKLLYVCIADGSHEKIELNVNI